MGTRANHEEPAFEAVVSVTQFDPDEARLLWVSMGSGAAGVMAPVIWVPGMADLGLAFIAGVALSFVLGIAGLLAPFFIAERFRKHRKLFNAKAVPIRLDAAGLSVPGLARIGWRDVLGIENIPDSEDCVKIQTAGHMGWLVKTQRYSEMNEALLPVLYHYMAQGVDETGAQTEFVARVRPFNRPVFYFLIALGYALVLGMCWVMVTEGTSKGPLTDLIAILVVGSTAAWAVWVPAFWSLGAFASQNNWTLRVSGHRLLCTHRKARHVIELRESRWGTRRAKGIGYEFPYLWVRASGFRKCFVPADDGWIDFLVAMQAVASANRDN